MPIRIIAIGKKHESWIAEGVQRYQKRLKRPFKIEWYNFTAFDVN